MHNPRVKEKETTGGVSILDDIPTDCSAMNRAILLQEKAAQHGFDWPEIEQVFDKLQEEVQELKHEINCSKDNNEGPDKLSGIQDELGDVIFCCMNLARFLKVDPAEALQGTNQKFERRFKFIEQILSKQNKKLKEVSLDELDAAWDEAKAKGY